MRQRDSLSDAPKDSDPRNPDAREQLERCLAFLARAARFWPILLGALLVGGIACGLFLHFKSPRYRSETVIFYAEKGVASDASEPAEARSVTLRLKELLLSRATLERVINEFDPYPELRRTLGMVDTVEELKKHIEFRAPGGDTISIAFEGSSPSQAQRITAELAHLVIDSDSTLRKDQARVAHEFLASESQTSEAQLREAEQKLAAFMAQHPRFALDATPLSNGAAIRATLGTGGPAAGGFPRPAAGGERWVPAAALSGGAAPKAVSPPSGAPNESRNAEALARAEVAAARENLAEQLLHYTPAHPDVRAAQATLTRANERLAALQAGGASPAQPVAEAGSASAPAAPPPRSTMLAAPPPSTSAPNSAKSGEQTKELVELETQWLTLTRAVTEARQRQDQVEEQLFKADIQSSSEGAGHGVQVNIIDPAFLPQRALPPGRTVLVLLFISGSLALGIIGALIRAAFDDRMFRARDALGIGEVLVEVPRTSRAWRSRVAI